MSDEVIESSTTPSCRACPSVLRRVVARMEFDGEIREMVFLTNTFTCSAQSLNNLYRWRWAIECSFKELKQTLQLADFQGTNGNAVLWQVWTALLAYALLRFSAFVSRWDYRLSGLFAPIQTALWPETRLARPA